MFSVADLIEMQTSQEKAVWHLRVASETHLVAPNRILGCTGRQERHFFVWPVMESLGVSHSAVSHGQADGLVETALESVDCRNMGGVKGEG